MWIVDSKNKNVIDVSCVSIVDVSGTDKYNILGTYGCGNEEYYICLGMYDAVLAHEIFDDIVTAIARTKVLFKMPKE